MMRYPDRFVEQAVEHVEDFINWGARNGAEVYLNELGWPYHHSEQDAAKWNRLGREVLKLCNRRNIAAVCWSDNGTPDYPFAPFQPGSQWGALNTTQRNGRPWMDFWRGARRRDSGLFFGRGHQNSVWGNPSTTQGTGEFKTGFSNVNVGVLNTDYAWNTAGDFSYMAERNLPCAWLSFRWERMQEELGAALNETYLAGLLGAVDAALAAGLRVVVQCFNKGAYYLHHDTQDYGVRHRIGNSNDGNVVTNAAFEDLWERLAAELSGKGPNFLGYAIMNEPATGSMNLWQGSSQAAVDAITSVDDTRNVYVSLLTWQHAASAASAHPTPWITGTLADAGKIKYGHSIYYQLGQYSQTYDEVAVDARSGYVWLDHFDGEAGEITSGTRTGDVGKRAWLTSGVELDGGGNLKTVDNSGEANRVAEVNSGIYQVQIAQFDTSTSGREHMIHFRGSWNANNDLWRFGLSGSTWYLQKRVGGLWETVRSTATTTTHPAVAGSLIEIEINGPLIVTRINGAEVYRVWDTYLQGCGIMGFSLSNAPNALIAWAGMKPIYHEVGLAA